MNRILQFILFFVIFLGIYLGLHFYAYFRITKLLELSKAVSRIILFLVIGLAVLFPLLSVIERFFSNSITRILYFISSAWLGFVFLLTCTLLIYELVKIFAKINPKTAGIIIISIALIASIYALINASLIMVKTVDIPMQNLNKPMKVVQISDLHLGDIHGSGYLQRVVEKINEINPDIVFITGDLLDSSSNLNKKTVVYLDKINAKTFFSFGNHEIYEGENNVTNIMKTTKVVTLRNEVTKYKGIQIIGVDYPQKESQRDNPVLKELKINKTEPSILLYHTPLGIEDTKKAGINLQLSGHTHRGQIFPLNLVVYFFYPKISGLYKISNSSYMYVSQGTGTWGPPMRLGSRNEITVLNLVPA